ncbi:MAG: cell envelope integrity protein CreD [Bacteroidales bacterium]|nr:cell envelope integrity protein CreD [Bacteroidales bacterium]
MISPEKKQWIKESKTLKVIGIGILALLLLIPAAMIQSLIREREQSFNQVYTEVGQKWGYPQTLSGPVITIPYISYATGTDGKTVTYKKSAYFLPNTLNITGEIIPETRYRGIYKVPVYKGNITVSGEFLKPNIQMLKIKNEMFLWDEATLTFGISDMRGIRNRIEVILNGKHHEMNPGTNAKDIIYSGLSCNIDEPNAQNITFSLNIELNGSQSLNFIPLGKETDVNIKSTWANPSFNGAFLPVDRNIDDKGFYAQWKVLNLNRNYPQQWCGNEYAVDESAFGVEFLMPVDHYQKNTRSAKYAIMFIALTFTAFLLFELISKKRIHPVQYLLVGGALCVFYTLLISFSEQIGFFWAYTVSSIATISLISLYFNSIIKSAKGTLVLSLMLVGLYLFLFTILQLQDYALLMGSIGLFAVISIVMYVSHKVDWYS